MKGPAPAAPSAATKVEKLEVRWPDGKVEEFRVEGVDRMITLEQKK